MSSVRFRTRRFLDLFSPFPVSLSKTNVDYVSVPLPGLLGPPGPPSSFLVSITNRSEKVLPYEEGVGPRFHHDPSTLLPANGEVLTCPYEATNGRDVCLVLPFLPAQVRSRCVPGVDP